MSRFEDEGKELGYGVALHRLLNRANVAMIGPYARLDRLTTDCKLVDEARADAAGRRIFAERYPLSPFGGQHPNCTCGECVCFGEVTVTVSGVESADGVFQFGGDCSDQALTPEQIKLLKAIGKKKHG